MVMKVILLAAGVAVAAALPAAPVSRFGARSAPTATGRNLRSVRAQASAHLQ